MTSLEILKTSWNLSDPIRLLTITAINLTDETADEQLSSLTAPQTADEENVNPSSGPWTIFVKSSEIAPSLLVRLLIMI